MIAFTLPNGSEYKIEHAVFDYNGTLAEDGVLAAETIDLLRKLAKTVQVSVLTADTFGLARSQLQSLPEVHIHIIDQGDEAAQKRAFVRACGKHNTICFGNGANDLEMFAEALLAVGVLGGEGAYPPTLAKADIIVTSPQSAIMLLLTPKRMVATLRT